MIELFKWINFHLSYSKTETTAAMTPFKSSVQFIDYGQYTNEIYEDSSGSSKANVVEARFICEISNHLLKNGNDPKTMTGYCKSLILN